VIYGGLGNDTIQLRFGEDVSTTDLASNLDNVEILDLSVVGANTIGGAADGLGIQDVLDITGSDTLTIMGDADDVVNLSDDWGIGVPDVSGNAVYTHTDSGTNAITTVKIDENIVVNLIVD
jgi:hypothetical protein